jgi:hypothetical protein
MHFYFGSALELTQSFARGGIDRGYFADCEFSHHVQKIDSSPRFGRVRNDNLESGFSIQIL